MRFHVQMSFTNTLNHLKRLDLQFQNFFVKPSIEHKTKDIELYYSLWY